MLARTLTTAVDVDSLAVPPGSSPSWILLYATEGFAVPQALGRLRARFPQTPVFGATSFRGVFTREGFTTSAACLLSETNDAIQSVPVLVSCSDKDGRQKARRACEEITNRLRGKPNLLLLHATPGFEERILEGIEDAVGQDVPIYGGSAADDTIAGRWLVFSGTETVSAGFLLVGMRTLRPIHAAFLGGYLPTEQSGIVTAAKGRIVETIDDKPAAVVYNEWTGGIVSDALPHGGNVLLKTNLHPVGRVVSREHGILRRALAHPCEVLASGALSFFAELPVGERITLMTGTKDPLITRVGKVVRRAMGGNPDKIRGGILVYCGGCLGVVLDRADEIPCEFMREAGDIPFVGTSTFGEEGAFFEERRQLSRHGNLMCSVVLFE